MISDKLFLPKFDPSDYYIELRKLTESEHLIDLWKNKQEITCLDLWKYLRRLFITFWVIKLNFNSKYKLPMTRQEQEFTKPLGVLYSGVWKACEKLHSFTKGEYRNAAHWFGLIVIEARVEGINLGTKGKSLKAIRSENKLLGDFKHPFEKSYPHTYKLFKLLIFYSEKYDCDILRKEVLEPIKKARKQYATAYQKSIYQIGIIENDKEYRQMPGSGTGRHELPRWTMDELTKTIHREESNGKIYQVLKSLFSKDFQP
jgi:hypothetical protein